MARNVRTVSYSLPPEIVDRLDALAAAAGISKSSYLTMLLSSVLSRPFVLAAVESEGRGD